MYFEIKIYIRIKSIIDPIVVELARHRMSEFRNK